MVAPRGSLGQTVSKYGKLPHVTLLPAARANASQRFHEFEQSSQLLCDLGSAPCSLQMRLACSAASMAARSVSGSSIVWLMWGATEVTPLGPEAHSTHVQDVLTKAPHRTGKDDGSISGRLVRHSGIEEEERTENKSNATASVRGHPGNRCRDRLADGWRRF